MNEPNEEVRKQLLQIVQKHVDQLGEHFENVTIFCSNVEQGGKHTSHFSLGTGNWYARYGQVKGWMVRQDEHEKISARANHDDSV